jgi:hypothetical protein
LINESEKCRKNSFTYGDQAGSLKPREILLINWKNYFTLILLQFFFRVFVQMKKWQKNLSCPFSFILFPSSFPTPSPSHFNLTLSPLFLSFSFTLFFKLFLASLSYSLTFLHLVFLLFTNSLSLSFSPSPPLSFSLSVCLSVYFSNTLTHSLNLFLTLSYYFLSPKTRRQSRPPMHLQLLKFLFSSKNVSLFLDCSPQALICVFRIVRGGVRKIGPNLIFNPSNMFSF